MANESTAIVELIQLAQQKALPRDSDVELMFAPSPTAPPRRFPRATGFEDDHAVTHRVVRHDNLVKPLFAATIAVASVAAFGLTVRLTRHKPTVATAAAAAAPAPKPDVPALPVVQAPPPKPTVQPIVQPIEAPTVVVAKPQLVALSLESQPSGAEVTLVDGTSSSIAGTTPLSLSVDPSREYDIVFTLADHPTKLAHVDPHTTQHVAIDLAPVAVQPPDPPAPSRHHAHAQARTAAVTAKGTGTLMISSKPPCEIAIDGKPTGMSTPQKEIALPAGSHHVTLTNAQAHVKKTYSFAVTAGHATKLVRDLTK